MPPETAATRRAATCEDLHFGVFEAIAIVVTQNMGRKVELLGVAAARPSQGDFMYKVFCDFVGLASGWLGGKRLNGDVDYAPSLDGVMGVAGTFIGGVFICVSGIFGSGGTALATMVAMICVAMLANSVSSGSGRRAIARNS